MNTIKRLTCVTLLKVMECSPSSETLETEVQSHTGSYFHVTG